MRRACPYAPRRAARSEPHRPHPERRCRPGDALEMRWRCAGDALEMHVPKDDPADPHAHVHVTCGGHRIQI
eukprot:4276411-Prymnesium_polylepis.2